MGLSWGEIAIFLLVVVAMLLNYRAIEDLQAQVKGLQLQLKLRDRSRQHSGGQVRSVAPRTERATTTRRDTDDIPPTGRQSRIQTKKGDPDDR